MAESRHYPSHCTAPDCTERGRWRYGLGGAHGGVPIDAFLCPAHYAAALAERSAQRRDQPDPPPYRPGQMADQLAFGLGD